MTQSHEELELSRRDILKVGTVAISTAMLSGASSPVAGNHQVEDDDVRAASVLVGKASDRPDPGGEFFRNKTHYAYVYHETDTGDIPSFITEEASEWQDLLTTPSFTSIDKVSESVSVYEGRPSINIENDPESRHKFSPVQAKDIEEVNKTIDGSSRTYLAYDSDPNGDEIRLYYSDDLSTQWTAYSGNPILGPTTERYRWPSATIVGNTIHLFLADRSGDPNIIERHTSTDGINFTNQETVVSDGDNPNIWRDPNTNNYVLIFRTAGGDAAILQSDSVTTLSSATETDVSLPGAEAAPTINYFANKYWIMAETNDELLAAETPGASRDAEVKYWRLPIYVSDNIDSGYIEAGDSPFVPYGSNQGACCATLSKHGADLYLFYNAQSPWFSRVVNFSVEERRPTFTTGVNAQKARESREYSNQGASVFATSSQTISDSTWTQVAWDSTYYDNISVAKEDVSNDVITIQQDGIYLIMLQIAWDSDGDFSSGDRTSVRIAKDGTNFLENRQEVAGGNQIVSQNVWGMEALREDEDIKAEVNQNSGGNVDLRHGLGSSWNRFTVTRLRHP